MDPEILNLANQALPYVITGAQLVALKATEGAAQEAGKGIFKKLVSTVADRFRDTGQEDALRTLHGSIIDLKGKSTIELALRSVIENDVEFANQLRETIRQIESEPEVRNIVTKAYIETSH